MLLLFIQNPSMILQYCVTVVCPCLCPALSSNVFTAVLLASSCLVELIHIGAVQHESGAVTWMH